MINIYYERYKYIPLYYSITTGRLLKPKKWYFISVESSTYHKNYSIIFPFLFLITYSEGSVPKRTDTYNFSNTEMPLIYF